MFAHYETAQGRIIDITSEDIKYPPLADKTPINSIECGENVQVGWFYVNGEFVDHIDEAIISHDVIETHAPDELTLAEILAAIQINTEFLICLNEINEGGE